ncbi:hypothetical protein DAEQUDRAFT_476463 [Daedalea quercina L-15889]|uniref:C2H2-type domain-containing protein n=1 Tax=Daedalea quercina L-15889 TaxID=1314783 RepID=A0A165MY57_9APHY|nr:hypothetical protein DAEQUDRAFT_476463 [Daedalea quercina L-15889]
MATQESRELTAQDIMEGFGESIGSAPTADETSSCGISSTITTGWNNWEDYNWVLYPEVDAPGDSKRAVNTGPDHHCIRDLWSLVCRNDHDTATIVARNRPCLENAGHPMQASEYRDSDGIDTSSLSELELATLPLSEWSAKFDAFLGLGSGAFDTPESAGHLCYISTLLHDSTFVFPAPFSEDPSSNIVANAAMSAPQYGEPTSDEAFQSELSELLGCVHTSTMHHLNPPSMNCVDVLPTTPAVRGLADLEIGHPLVCPQGTKPHNWPAPVPDSCIDTEGAEEQQRMTCSFDCGATFTMDSNRERHERTSCPNLPQDRKESWTCEICGFTCSRRDSLRRHFRAVDHSSMLDGPVWKVYSTCL